MGKKVTNQVTPPGSGPARAQRAQTESAGPEPGGPIEMPPPTPDPEVLETPRRRRFAAEYKQQILRQADACPPGGLGELLRREGLYSSHLNTWRRQRDQGVLAALTPQKRGRKARQLDPMRTENQRLLRENERLAARLRQAEAIIDVQKKVSELLGIPLKPLDFGEHA